MTGLATLAGEASLEQDIRKSRFLCRAAPVVSTAEALAFIEQVSVPDATHNCWAWRLGQDYRFNDGGEPAGSAGRPILAAIDGQGMDRVVAVVTRWFGGTKLGVGGLVRAYGGCAAECLRAAPRVPIVELADVEVHAGFAELPLLHSRLARFEANKLDERFSATGGSLHLQLPRERVDELAEWVEDLTRGQGSVSRLDPQPE